MSDQRDTVTDLITQNVLWESYVRAGEKAWMRKEHTEALRNFTVAREKSKHFRSGDWRHIKSLQSLSRIYYELKNFSEAERLQAELLKLIEAHSGADSVEMISELRHMASIYEQEKKFQEAEQTYRFIIDNHPTRTSGLGDPTLSFLRQKCNEMKQLQKQKQQQGNASGSSGGDIEWIG